MKTRNLFRMMAIAFAAIILFAGAASMMSAQQICGSNSSGPLGNVDQYSFGGDQWNASFSSTYQCETITNSTAPPPSGPSMAYSGNSFDDTTGTPADYPDFTYGCFYGACTQNTQLPIQVSALSNYSITSGETVVEPSGASNDVAYDIWFNTGPTTPTNQNTTGTEMMIWVQRNGGVGPSGPVTTITSSGITWNVYTWTNTGNCNCSGTGSQVIDFINAAPSSNGPTSGTTFSLNLVPFFEEALALGQIQSSWYLTTIEFGTEIWVGGPGIQVNNFWVNVGPAGGGTTTEAPYPGPAAAAVPGTVLAENYDAGGQGVSYNVTSTNGSANSYRSQGVDLEAATAPATGNDLGWSAAGQWFKYTVNVATAGSYKISFLVASPTAVADAFHISNSSGTNLTGSVAVPATGGYQTWTTVTATVTLPAGTQTLTLNEDGAGWNFDSLAFAANGGGGTTEAPYPGPAAAAVPGTVLAENYDAGGQGVSYNVTSTNGSANTYRAQGVDLEAATAPATGNDLGWSAAGQWFRYTVNVATAGTYTVSFLVASPTAVADAFHLSNSSGTSLTGSVAVPATGGYQTWVTVKATVTLPAGTQTLTMNEDAAGWNIDSIAFVSSGGGGGGSITNGTYVVIPQNATALRLDDKSASTATGNPIDVYTANGTAAQNWAFSNTGVVPAGYYKISTLGAYCLTASGTASGSAVVLDPCAGSSAQAWEAVASGSNYTFHPANNTGNCLDVSGAGTASGTVVQVYTCNATAAQSWAF
jgi:post-segregation antitoxin (ccd killing protein)